MKFIKHFIFMMLFLGIAFGFSACSDKNDEPGDPAQEFVEGKWTEQGNKLIYKITYAYGLGVSYTAVWTLTFDGDTCIKSECACTFDSSQLADAFYESWKDTEYPATKSGKTVTVDWTVAHRGMSKTDVKKAIDAMGGLS